jgi:AcrR family transcriptional regulator
MQVRRHSADERRRLVIEAASQEFAAFGLYGATGESISYRAGISHPYLLRLFGSKKDLFRAVIDNAFHDLEAGVAERIDGAGPDASSEALESAIDDILEHGQRSALLLQFIAACGDDEVRPIVRRRFAELYDQLARLSEGDEAELRAVFARVILRSATAAMRLSEIASREPWARRLLEP